jgi:EAL domain-containing protein (putative c-di-GMP-specific phosphodiesterase class I)
MESVNFEQLKKIIDTKSVQVHYQPIVSILRKAIIGFEGLSRGVLEEKKDFISPTSMFSVASDGGIAIDLDRLCREKVIEGFSPLYNKNKDLLLFLNIDGSVMTDDVVGSGVLLNLVEQFNIKPENVVLEIVESKINDDDALSRFIDTYRGYGFLIGLDNVGCGISNLDRIAFIQPDLIKIDKVIVDELHLNYYKQEVFKALVGLAKNLGAMVIAEGVENEQEAIKAIEFGADLLQGYYFAKPKQITSTSLKGFTAPVRKLSTKYSSYLEEKIDMQKQKYKDYGDIIKNVLQELEGIEEKRLNYKLVDVIMEHKIFECIYILDSSGVQVTDTVTPYMGTYSHKSLIFKPAKKGDDHSLKKYYYFLKNMRLSKYITEPYISLATGNLCITMSCVFKNIEGKKYIFCVDFNPDFINI